MEGERLTGALFECVPNISEGRNQSIVSAMAAAAAAVPGALLLDRTSDLDHHRSVITLAGPGDALVEAAVRIAGEAAHSIDLNLHRGIHPRVGALDVLPFVPLQNATLADAAALAHRAGSRIALELGVPVYFYGAAALRPERQQLENVRRGQFEGLRELAPADPERAPDLGGFTLHRTAGAVIAGARPILIAFNLNLQTADVAIAQSIARQIRASSGGLAGVKALGLPLHSRRSVQVSMNLTDIEVTPLHVVYRRVEELARSAGTAIAEAELIGLLPRRAVEQAAADGLYLPVFAGNTIEERIAAALA